LLFSPPASLALRPLYPACILSDITLEAERGRNRFQEQAMQHLGGVHAKQVMKVAKMVLAAIGAFALILAMSGCASTPQRVWHNGATISSSRAYWSMMRGDHSFQNMRQVYGNLDPYRSLYQPLPYPYFGRW
jgi:hypothetical protein